MKLTKLRLKQIIKEELNKVLKEADSTGSIEAAVKILKLVTPDDAYGKIQRALKILEKISNTLQSEESKLELEEILEPLRQLRRRWPLPSALTKIIQDLNAFDQKQLT